MKKNALLLLTMVFLVLVLFPGEARAWYNNTYSNQLNISIDGTKIIDDGYYTFWIDMSELPSEFWDSLQYTDGRDILIVDESNNKLYFEVANISTTTKTGQLHFRNEYAAGVSENITIYSNCTVAPELTDSFQEATWPKSDGFMAVYHLENDDGTTKDSSQNNYHMSTESMDTSNLVTTPIGRGFDFDGSADYLNYINPDLNTTYNLTVMVLAFPHVLNKDYGVIRRGDLVSGADDWFIRGDDAYNDWAAWSGQDTETSYVYDVAANQWGFYWLTYNNSITAIFTNQTMKEAVSRSGVVPENYDLQIGVRWKGNSATHWYDGLISEAFVFNSTLSPEAIETYYNSFEGSPVSTGFMTMGSVALRPSGGGPAASSISIESPTNTTYYGPNVWFNVTTSGGYDALGCWVDFGYGNETMSNDTATHFYYHNTTMLDGVFTAQFYCNFSDSIRNRNETFTVWLLPKYSGVAVSPASGQTYPLSTAQFNITWTSEHMDTAFLEANFTGTMVNYSMSNESSEYFFIYTSFDAGNYSYRFWANDTAGKENLTGWYQYTVNKADSNIALNINPAWTVTEQEVTITCSADTGLNLRKDGGTVSNPYTALLSPGTYIFNCTVDDQKNYYPVTITRTLTVHPVGYGCVDTNTYAFSKTLTGLAGDKYTINLTYLIQLGQVKDDFTDIFYNGTAWKNSTDGYYLTLNVTGKTNATIYFGNYMANNTYSEAPIEINITNITTYAEDNAYVFLTFLDEKTGNQQLPPGANTTVILYCESGVNDIDIGINDTEVIFPTTDMNFTKVRADVIYSATEIYSRSYLVNAPVEYKNIYLVDANEYQVAQLLLSLYDTTGDFGGSLVQAKRRIAGTLRTITELYFDAEDKAILYLVNNDEYQIYVDNGDEVRNIGFMYVDSVDLTKTITIGDLIELDNYRDGCNYTGPYYDNATNSFVFAMYDSNGNINQADFYVYNLSDDSLLYHATTTNSTLVEFNYVVPDINGSYQVRVHINHTKLGTESIDITLPFILGALVPAFPFVMPFVGEFELGFQTGVVLVLVIAIGLLFGALHGGVAGVVVTMFGALFTVFQWWEVSLSYITILFFLAVLNKMVERRDVA